MDVIKRNFFALLQTGAFGKMQQFALAGYTKQQYQNVRHIPQPILHDLKSHPQLSLDETYASSRLSNKFLNNRLKAIREGEPHAMDTSIETLHVLNIIVHNVEDTLNKGVVLRGIVDLGIYLRTMGHKVDFVKLESWLNRLHIESLAQFQGSILILLLGFEEDEVPFTKRIMGDAEKATLKSVERTAKDTSEKWDFKQDKSLWLHANSGAIKQSMRRSFHYLLYAPIETISNLTYKFAKNLSELEE